MPPPKVLHFISNAARSPYFCLLAETVQRDQFELIVATLSPSGPLQEDMRARGIRTFALDATKRSQYPWAILRLARLLRQEHVSIIQNHLFDASLVGLLAGRAAQVPLTVLTRHHADAVLLSGSRRAFWIDRLCSQRLAGRIIAVSNCGAAIIRKYERVNPRKIAVVQLGFDFTRLRPSGGARSRVREQHSLGQRPVLCAVGRLDPLKGYPVLFHALAQLVPSFSDLRVLIVGDGPEREHLVDLRGRLGLDHHIILTGFRPDVPDVLAASDVLVHPSLSESFNQVIIEAAALGLPVIATDVGDTRQVLQDGVTGWIVPPRDVDALAAAIRATLAHPERWAAMGAQGQQRVQQYSGERMVRAYEGLYAQWLGEV